MTNAPPSDTWALVRAAYCDTAEPVAKICGRLHVREKELYRRIEAEAWGKRSAKVGFVHPFKRSKGGVPGPELRPGENGADVPLPAKVPRARKRSGTPAKKRRRLTPAQKRTKAALALRLYNALDLKLTQLEELMEDGKEKSTIDQGRQTRAISQLIKAFERVTEYDPDLLKSASLAGLDPDAAARTPAVDATAGPPGSLGASTAPSPDAAATEQLRRDIANRIERLVALRKSSENSGGPAAG